MLSDLKKPPVLVPMRFESAELPEVVELFGEDGQRQFALAESLSESQRRSWGATEAAPL